MVILVGILSLHCVSSVVKAEIRWQAMSSTNSCDCHKEKFKYTYGLLGILKWNKMFKIKVLKNKLKFNFTKRNIQTSAHDKRNIQNLHMTIKRNIQNSAPDN